MAQYIDKSALVAEIEERRDNLIALSESCPINTVAKAGYYAQAQTLEGIKKFIDTLEVKDVDIDKEIGKFFGKDDWKASAFEEEQRDMIKFAGHFFELGLNYNE